MEPMEARLLENSTPSLEPAQKSAHHDRNATRSKRFRGFLAKVRASPWLPIAARGAAIVGFMLGFAAVGATASFIQPPGVHLASQISPNNPIFWLAPTPEAEVSQVPKPETPTLAPSPPVPAEPGAHSVRVAANCKATGGLCDDQTKPNPPEGVTSDGKVILNVASAEVLTRLPGVGARRAQSIVELRERLKGFRRTTDLLRVRGIGVKSLKRMLPHLVLDPPATEDKQPPEPSLAL